MTLKSHELELLSPARNADIGIEAVNHGADAVYIGGPNFGARVAASNSIQDIERLCRHAHRFGSKIFVTLNTILRDDELEPARRMVQQVYEAGADALIVQDMGLMMVDLPPIQLHASTQADIRSAAKAKFLQDAGFSQLVLARELSLQQIKEIHEAINPERGQLEFFVHGALCVAYSGQCYISHAHTGRSANRGDCSQACRLPYEVVDSQGRIVAHQKHVLSMKDNNQTENLAALIGAGIRSFKIEGRYKDLAYVKNITAHYRLLLDQFLEANPEFTKASDGKTSFAFTPDPHQNFNREFTDYFVNGRKDDIGAFDTPKNPGIPIGWVHKISSLWIEIETIDASIELNNGDGLCYYSLQRELQGLALNQVERLPHSTGLQGGGPLWRVYPKDPIKQLQDLRVGLAINRNRDMAWVRKLDKKSSDRRIAIDLEFNHSSSGFELAARDDTGAQAKYAWSLPNSISWEEVRDPSVSAALEKIREQLDRLGSTIFEARSIQINLSAPIFIPASLLNQARREVITSLERARKERYVRPARAAPIEPFTPYPEQSLSYLANVFNHKARDFYQRHGVQLIAAAYESHEEQGEVSLMITKHCVRFSLSLCPKQAKGVTGVQGTVRAEPMQLINGKERLTLRFDCKPCEMHVVGKIKPAVIAAQRRESPLRFYKTRPIGTS